LSLYRLLLARQEAGRPIRIGVIGAGKFASMFLSQVIRTPGMKIVCVADIKPQKARQACLKAGWPEDLLSFGDSAQAIDSGSSKGKTVLTADSYQLLQADLDVVVEATGIPDDGAYHAWTALEAGKHVVMVNVEADTLLGAALKKHADRNGLVYSLAYGDQPALILEQVDWARSIGLEVVCAGKGTRYQPEYHYSTPETVWQYYGFSQEQVASGDYNAQMFNSFLDGTKSAIEMCAVANASGLIPQKGGLMFPSIGIDELANVLRPKRQGGILEHSGTVEVVASERRDGRPVERDLRWGVYVVFRAHTDYVRRCFLEYGLRTDSSGAYAAMYRPYHLIGLELGISIASAMLRNESTGSPQTFVADVASVAKKDMGTGDMLDGEGGFTVYGKLVRADESIEKKYLPIGLTSKATLKKPVAKDYILTYGDVELDSAGFCFQLRKSIELELRH